MASIKLTLNIEERVIIKAKKYAVKQNISLSWIVENYLSALGEKEKDEFIVADWVKELKAVKKPVADFNHKSAYKKHIIEKYSK